MRWTKDQQRVIDTRGRNILVSAAAGSGKTAVLVERILKRILDPVQPVNIDELLIVTFTKAAAGEMRERIMKALADEREKQPDNLHLARQNVLIHNAQITTIDGFCSYVIRNYAHTIDLVPGFRVAEEGEARLLRSDACEAVIEEGYGEADEAKRAAFYEFVETFASGKSDASLEQAIMTVYDAAQSSPDPSGWLAACERELQTASQEEFLNCTWMQEYLADAGAEIELLYDAAKSNLELTERADGPAAYRPNAEAYLRLAESLRAANGNYEAIRTLLASIDIPALSRKKAAPEENPSYREQYKKDRDDRIKPVIDELTKNYFQMALDDAWEFQQKSAGPLQVLIDLTRRMMDRYSAEKRKKNLMDFADLEHFALKILRNETGERTFVAKELAGRFAEVMIDEYQDSNYLQEAILTAVSGNEDGVQNYFCVGDVKQSIYSFRQARPELFMEKYDRYHADEAAGVRIDLHQNFRSSQQVVDTVNGVFSQIMRREIGGVEYDEAASLVKGAAYPDVPNLETEVIPVLLDEDRDDFELDDVRSASQRELEARAVGSRIREMVGTEQIYDLKQERLRPIEYRDIVILLRTTKGWSDSFVRVLEGMRIPVYSETKQGYFDALEVETVLNYLSLVDNPQQDIPMTAVLTSPFVSMNADDLAKIRTCAGAKSWTGSTERDAVSMYDAARAYQKHGEEARIRSMLDEFFALFDEIRSEVHSTPLHELIYRIIHESGYADYAAALPGGSQRILNLRMLIDKSIAYETTSYVGLFNFIRYINQMKDKELDFGELSSIGENENVVRIYSIHKSKGLEYPVVFVAGMSKKFNLRDVQSTILTHPTLGIAADYVDFEHRVKAPTMRKLAIRNRKLKDSIGEELRVLYVALTRAKQKLILTGTMKDEKQVDDLYLDLPLRTTQFSTGYLMSQKNYMGWVIPAVKRMLDRAEKDGIAGSAVIRLMKPSMLAGDEVASSVRRAKQLESLRTLKSDVIYDPAMHKAIQERFSWQYPYAGGAEIPVEVSVSELKEASYRDNDEEFSEESNMEILYREQSDEPLIPEFMRSTESKAHKTTANAEPEQPSHTRLTGAARGSAYHKIMELISMKATAGYHGAALRKELTEQLELLLKEGKLTEEEADALWMNDLMRFLESDLGARMIAADQRQELYREQPFVLGVPASEIREEWPEEEMVFVQGMIDAFFYEGEDIILVDYKTDFVTVPEELKERYHVQTEQYANALSRVTGRTVRETWLWSFRLDQAINCTK